MNKYEKICEMDVSDIIKTALAGNTPQEQPCQCAQAIKSVQPTDNVGQSGMISSPTVEITETDDGGIKLKTENICVKLSKMAIEALKTYLQKKEE